MSESNLKDASSSLRMKTRGSSRGVIGNSKLEIPVINIPNVVCIQANLLKANLHFKLRQKSE